MKSFFILTILLIPPLMAKDLYIKALLTSAYESPKKEKVVKKLKRGQKVQELKKENNWLQVSINEQKAWVMKLVTTDTPPAKKKSIFGNKKVNLQNKARKRASSFSSAASVRGFMQGKKETFTIMDQKDEKSLQLMESFKISEKAATKWYYK